MTKTKTSRKKAEAERARAVRMAVRTPNTWTTPYLEGQRARTIRNAVNPYAGTTAEQAEVDWSAGYKSYDNNTCS